MNTTFKSALFAISLSIVVNMHLSGMEPSDTQWETIIQSLHNAHKHEDFDTFAQNVCLIHDKLSTEQKPPSRQQQEIDVAIQLYTKDYDINAAFATNFVNYAYLNLEANNIIKLKALIKLKFINEDFAETVINDIRYLAQSADLDYERHTQALNAWKKACKTLIKEAIANYDPLTINKILTCNQSKKELLDSFVIPYIKKSLNTVKNKEHFMQSIKESVSFDWDTWENKIFTETSYQDRFNNLKKSFYNHTDHVKTSISSWCLDPKNRIFIAGGLGLTTIIGSIWYFSSRKKKDDNQRKSKRTSKTHNKKITPQQPKR